MSFGQGRVGAVIVAFVAHLGAIVWPRARLWLLWLSLIAWLIPVAMVVLLSSHLGSDNSIERPRHLGAGPFALF